MNLLYYNEHIKEEMEDACAYVHNALCCKATNQSQADQFVKLSEQELSHARILYEMYQDEFKGDFEKCPDVHACMSEMYNDNLVRIQLLLQAYSKQ